MAQAEQLQQFQAAVLASFDPTSDPSLRSQASASLEGLRQAEDGWVFCLQAFTASSEERVKFWCLQTCVDMVVRERRYPTLPEERKQQLRTALLSWVQSKGTAQTDEPASVKNKFAQLLIAIVRHDYPAQWPELFPQLLATLQNGPVSIDLFLRILNALHEEVVVNEEGNGYDSEVASRVKDAMRERCLPQLAEAWLNILRLHESTPSLSSACLHTIHHYVPWIPIGLVANAPWLSLLQILLRSSALHEGACLVLCEIVLKRMEPQSKMEHLSSLRIVSMLAEGVAHHNVAISTRLAALVSALAMELLECWDRLGSQTSQAPAVAVVAAQATEMLAHTFPLLLQCFASSDTETSSATLAFLHSYIGRLRKLLPSPKDLSSHESHLHNLLMVMGSKSVHPTDFDFEKPDELEEHFLSYRRELSTLVKGVARVHPSLAQDFVQRTLRSTLEAIESAPWTHLEVALWLLYTLGEGLPDSLLREKGGYFQQLMELLLSSRAAAHPHRAVQLLYFEIIVRYYRFFLSQPSYLPGALSSFLGDVGLFNSVPSVRERVCYLLLRFVKQTIRSATREFFDMVSTLRSLLAPQRAEAGYDDLLSQLSQQGFAQEGISPPPAASLHTNGFGGLVDARGKPPTLTDAEQIQLFEACGLLLGGNLAAPAEVGEQLRQLLEKPLARLQLLCSHAAAAGAPNGGHDGGGGGEAEQQLTVARAGEAAFQIAVIAHVSKGFGELATDAALLRESFSRATQVALAAMGAFGSSPEVRTKALMLLHRMVETLGEALLGYLDSALPQLLTRADAKELVELVTLVNQLVLKFRNKIVVPVTALFSALAGATFSHLQGLDAQIAASSSASGGASAPASEDVRERRALLRGFYSLVHSMVHSDLTGVLHAPANAAHTEPSLRLLLAGCVEGPDLQLQRQCFSILQRLVDQWVGSIPGFDGYVLRDVLPVCFSAIAQPHFTLKDAAALPLLEASASLQKAMVAKLGADVTAAYLRDQLLPSLGCSAELGAEYARQVCTADARQLRDFIKVQLLHART